MHQQENFNKSEQFFDEKSFFNNSFQNDHQINILDWSKNIFPIRRIDFISIMSLKKSRKDLCNDFINVSISRNRSKSSSSEENFFIFFDSIENSFLEEWRFCWISSMDIWSISYSSSLCHWFNNEMWRNLSFYIEILWNSFQRIKKQRFSLSNLFKKSNQWIWFFHLGYLGCHLLLDERQRVVHQYIYRQGFIDIPNIDQNEQILILTKSL